MSPVADLEAVAARSPRRRARRTVLLAAWGLLLAAVFAVGALRSAAEEKGAASKPAAAADARVARGRYLVTVAGCNDCHTPLRMGASGPEPDMSRMLSGHPEGMPLPAPPKLPAGPWSWTGAGTLTAFAGPWGISYASNLTPDRNTGLGIWSEAMFIAALRTGKHMGQSRPILPPMPWRWTGQMSDEDLGAIYAYLRAIPPVHNRVPDAEVAPAPPPGGSAAG